MNRTGHNTIAVVVKPISHCPSWADVLVQGQLLRTKMKCYIDQVLDQQELLRPQHLRKYCISDSSFDTSESVSTWRDQARLSKCEYPGRYYKVSPTWQPECATALKMTVKVERVCLLSLCNARSMANSWKLEQEEQWNSNESGTARNYFPMGNGPHWSTESNLSIHCTVLHVRPCWI